MRIEKEYNVQGLADKVKGCIKTACETKSRNVSLDVITAQEIVDVLETVASWENKKVKPSDIRKEILEQECFGKYDDDMECTVCLREDECKKETKVRKQENEEAQEHRCFGAYDGSKTCEACKRKEDCKENMEIVKMMKQSEMILYNE